MLAWAAASVFVMVAAGTSFLLLRFGCVRVRPMDRLQPPAPVVSGFLPLPSLIWQELVGWAGGLVPATPKSLPLLKRRLMRAGFRDPAAVRLFYGARVCAAMLLGGGALLIGLRTCSSQDDLFLITGAAALAGFAAPMQYLRWRIARRKHAIEKALDRKS